MSNPSSLQCSPKCTKCPNTQLLSCFQRIIRRLLFPNATGYFISWPSHTWHAYLQGLPVEERTVNDMVAFIKKETFEIPVRQPPKVWLFDHLSCFMLLALASSIVIYFPQIVHRPDGSIEMTETFYHYGDGFPPMWSVNLLKRRLANTSELRYVWR